MLSYISLNQRNWQADSYLSLSGVSSKSAVQFLKDYPNISDVIFCLDNDMYGINADERIKQIILESFENRKLNFIVKKSVTKDWNNDLQNLKNKSQSSILSAKNLYQEMLEQENELYDDIRYQHEQCHCYCEEENYYKASETINSILKKLCILAVPLTSLERYVYSEDLSGQELMETFYSVLDDLKIAQDTHEKAGLVNKLTQLIFQQSIEIDKNLSLSIAEIEYTTPEISMS